MSIAPGTRLGPYEVLAPLGAGGMGEVYKARDTRLDRSVAIKVLPERSSLTPEARQRFEREARTISQLQHPHICALHDVGREGDTEYLVMELLEGETLAERLARGALPLEQALRFGADIADALDKAHRQGIVHRDLKPGNVMVTKSGVKLLDFGLAKAFSSTPASAPAFTALPTAVPNLTQDGAILGTVQYMAPEQLEGKTTDARTDIFALGCLLYEMCTGHKAFSGSSQASLISSIMKEDPAPISNRTPMSPASLDVVVKTCLAKDPEDRWQTARDVAIQLEAIRDDRSSPRPIAVGRQRSRSLSILPWAVAAAALAVAAYAWISARQSPAPLPVVQTFLPPPPKTNYHVIGANIGGVALSRDGRRLAFGAREPDAPPSIWVRDLDQLSPYRIPGTEGGLYAFWSPDGRWLGFFARGKLKIVEAVPSPSPPRDLADIVEARGGSWGEGGNIVYAYQNFGPLLRVSANGGAPTPVTKVGKSAGEAHRWPFFLPGGRRFLFLERKPDPKSPLEVAQTIHVGSLDSGETREILPKVYEATSGTYAPPGYLLYRRGSSLMAVRVDPDTLALKGDPILLSQDVQGFIATGTSIYSASEKMLVYCPRAEAGLSKMVWLDRSGKEVAMVGPPGRIVHLAMSPDGRAVVTAQIEEPLPPDLWFYDTAVGRGVRLTRDTYAQVAPVFSSDGQRAFYTSYHSGPWDLWEIPVSGTREQKIFFESPNAKTPNDVSPDGRYLIYRELTAGTRGDLKYVSLTGDRQPHTFVATADDETNADFSPDSRWVAYASDESGRQEVYVASFPDPARKVRVSSEGGSQPRWGRDGKELFYVRSGQLLTSAVTVKGDEISFGDSRPLFRLPLFTTIDPGFDVITRYDVAPDGRFLALLRVSEEAPTPLVVVQNWAEALKGK
jgi:eukaryotic-like serine/threonine-protein kinase